MNPIDRTPRVEKREAFRISLIDLQCGYVRVLHCRNLLPSCGFEKLDGQETHFYTRADDAEFRPIVPLQNTGCDLRV